MYYSYATRDELKTVAGVTGTTDDAQYRRVLEAVTAQLDAFTRRTFRTHLATYYFTAQSSRRVLLDSEELGLGLLSVTTLKTDEDGDRTYETTWATTDYDLLPANAAHKRRPYWEIAITPQGNESFPRVQKGVEVVGKWGHYEDLVRSASLMAEGLDATESGIDVDDGDDFEILQTILVDSEQMYITGIATNTLTVVRGVNGTTAATHLDDAVIDVYRYPYAVTEATLMQAARLWTRRAAGYANQVGFSDTGTMRPWVGMDIEVQEMLAAYRLVGAG
jgi:hypothetical protein